MIEKLRYLLIFLILISLLPVGCDLLTNNSDKETETQKIVLNNGVEYTLTIEKNVYSITDSLKIEFIVTNKGITSKNFDFNNIQQIGFMLKDGDNEVELSYPSIVSPALSHFKLEPNQSKKLSITHPFKNFNGNYINRGGYTLFVYLSNGNSPEVTLKIIIL